MLFNSVWDHFLLVLQIVLQLFPKIFSQIMVRVEALHSNASLLNCRMTPLLDPNELVFSSLYQSSAYRCSDIRTPEERLRLIYDLHGSSVVVVVS